jgi:hypothetical protein
MRGAGCLHVALGGSVVLGSAIAVAARGHHTATAVIMRAVSATACLITAAGVCMPVVQPSLFGCAFKRGGG